MCRRCTKIIVFANGPSDSFGGVGRGLADFFTVDDASPEQTTTVAEGLGATKQPESDQDSDSEREKTAESRKRKLEAIAAKQKRIKAKRAAEND